MKGGGNLPDDLRAALEETPGAARAFEEFPSDQAADLAEWVKAARTTEHRASRVQMVVELIVDHFARLRSIDLTQEPSQQDD